MCVDPDVSLTAQAYAYAGGNPLNAIDPTGLSWWNPFSWHRVWHDVATAAQDVVSIARDVRQVAKVVAFVAAGVMLCALTECLGDLAFIGIDADVFYAALGNGGAALGSYAEGVQAATEAVTPIAQRVEMFADGMSAADSCPSDVGSQACLNSTRDLASTARDYYLDQLGDDGSDDLESVD
ncbi:MAG TPA: hypothetical protein VGG83_28705 [Trebonia sp.]